MKKYDYLIDTLRTKNLYFKNYTYVVVFTLASKQLKNK